MKLLLLLILTVASLSGNTQTLLVPDDTVTFEKYQTKCSKEGYICTHNYFVQQELQALTPLFDRLIDEIDLNQKDFVATLVKNSQVVLQKEMISTEQLEMLFRLLDQVEAQQQYGSHKQLLREIKFIQQSLATESLTAGTQEEVVVYFKKLISPAKFFKLKRSYLQLPYKVIAFNKHPATAVLPSAPLTQGYCQDSKLNFETDYKDWKIHSEKSCGWTRSLLNSTSHLKPAIKENKGWLITGALLVGAAVLANQYEVSFEF